MFRVECLQSSEVLFEYGNVWLEEGVAKTLRGEGGGGGGEGEIGFQ